VRALRVLSADDHPANRAVIEVILGLVDAELISVEDGAQACDVFKSGDFDIVLMDLQMPVMDGLAAIREIRRFEAETRRRPTPVLVISANAMSEQVAAAHAAGADRHISKPITPNILLETLGQMVEASAEPDATGLHARA
jgi:CheY-like chemotaxis protein